MNKFKKITIGFVVQNYKKNSENQFICTHQEFVAGDTVDHEDCLGNKITPPEHEYQPFEMTLSTGQQMPVKSISVKNFAADIINALRDVTSYASELVCQANDQADLSEIKEIKQAIETINRYKDAGVVFVQLKNACQIMLETLDIGGEQSRQFTGEITMLKDALDAAQIKITATMITKARKAWPDLEYFDFVRCTNCTFLGLVQQGLEKCPECKKASLEWADENNTEFSL